MLQFMLKADHSGDGTLDECEFKSFIEVCCVIDAKIKEGPPTKQIEFDGNLSFSSSTGGQQKVEEFSGAVTDGLTKLRSQPEVISPSWHRLSSILCVLSCILCAFALLCFLCALVSLRACPARGSMKHS